MQAKPKLNRRSKWHQGYYVPLNPHKVIGNSQQIIYRSRWEREFLKWVDTSSKVTRWASEECVILYNSPVDGKEHRYYLDFFIETRLSDGTIKRYLIEIKPFAQTQAPKVPKRMTEKAKSNYKEAIKTYMINAAKWKAAKSFCEKRNWEFVILTEKDLFRRQ